MPRCQLISWHYFCIGGSNIKVKSNEDDRFKS